jgi:alpha-1,3-rhamnosyl/mannosyltransferase
MSPQAAREFWRQVATGEPLPGKPDVVLSFNFHAPRMPHTKLIYTVHDLAFWVHPEFATDETRLVCQREILQALARAAGFLFVSEHTAREFEQLFPEWLHLHARPHSIAPGASRFPIVRAVRPAGSDAPWLMVGSLEPRKNHVTALEAYAMYHTHSVQRRPLVLAGGAGWKSAAVREQIAALQAQGLPVQHAGYVPESQLAELYEGAFALLAPSWHEGFGLPLVEAFSSGIPVLAGSRTSLPEVGGAAAIYFPPDNPRALADAMIDLELSAGVREARAAASLERAAAFSWARTAKSVLEFVGRVNSVPTHA